MSLHSDKDNDQNALGNRQAIDLTGMKPVGCVNLGHFFLAVRTNDGPRRQDTGDR